MGGLENPKMAFEGILNYSNVDSIKTQGIDIKGLVNYEAMQFYMGIGFETKTGNDKQSERYQLVGADVPLSQFYISPEGRLTINSDDEGTKSKTTTTELSLEGGIRAGEFRGFVRLESEYQEVDYPELSASNTETTDKTIGLGGYYNF